MGEDELRLRSLSEEKDNPYRCPRCGAVLIPKEGMYGPFMACPRYPECRFTKPMWLYTKQTGEAPCQKCRGSGLLPFIKDRKIIPHAFVDCECKREDQQEGIFNPLRPSDFDFAVSQSFHDSLKRYHGWDIRLY